MVQQSRLHERSLIAHKASRLEGGQDSIAFGKGQDSMSQGTADTEPGLSEEIRDTCSELQEDELLALEVRIYTKKTSG